MKQTDGNFHRFDPSAQVRQFEIVLSGQPPALKRWIGDALLREGFSQLSDAFDFAEGWTLHYATIGSNRRAFWMDFLGDELIPFLPQHLSLTAAALLVRTEARETRAVMTVFESRGGQGTIRKVASRLNKVIDDVARQAGDTIIEIRNQGAPVPALTPKALRMATRWDQK